MVRSRSLLVTVLLVLAPVVGLCQQETSKAGEAPSTAPTVAARVVLTPVPLPNPPAVPPAVAHGVATALERTSGAVVKTVPTPPPGSWGVVASADAGGGMFLDTGSDAEAWLATNGQGIFAFGSAMAGHFQDTDSSGLAYVAYGNDGIYASGTNAGGYFYDSDSSGHAWIGYGDEGLSAYGSLAGGFFASGDLSGQGYVGVSGGGVEGLGSVSGGFFQDTDSSDYAYVGYSTYKIYGTGSVSFVQNHPYDPSAVIVYAAPEGDEVATYTRGTARLVNGEATVPLGATFKWVTDPDIGLTAFLTPTGEWCDLYLAEQTTESLTVRSRDGADCTFNYLVYGLRIGFEDTSVVQEKKQEAYIPSMKDDRDLYARRPDLRRYDALERFKEMRRAVGTSTDVDLSGANALRDAVVEFDPAVQKLPASLMAVEERAAAVAARGKPDGKKTAGEPTRRPAPTAGPISPDRPAAGTAIPVDADGNVYASSFRPSARDLASLLKVSEAVEPGDVLVIDRSHPGRMRLAREGADPGVVGIVAAAPGLVLGARPAVAKPAVDGQAGVAASPGATQGATTPIEVPVALSGVVLCKVDASYGAVWPGDLLVTSPTPGRAMRQEAPLPGTVLGKALEPLAEGAGTIKVLVMLR